MNAEYEDLDMEGILRLSRSDAEHAGDMAEQARVVREMGGALRDKVDLMTDVMRTLFGTETESGSPGRPAWNGASSQMMQTELNRLADTFQDAPDVLERNASTLDDLSTRAHSTLVEIDQLYVESAGGTGKGGDAATSKARQIMRDASSGYLTSAEEMPEPKFYNGLRQSAEGDPVSDQPSSPEPNPALTPVQPTQPQQHTALVADQPAGEPEPATPTLQSGPAPTAPAPAPTPSPTPGPTGPGPVAPIAHPVTAPPPRPSGGPGYTPRPGGGPGLAPRPRPTVPSVIGSRPGGPAPVPSRPATPAPGQPVRPVVGTRPTVPAPVSRPVTPPASRPGAVPPVIGSRPGAGNVPAPVPSNPNGVTRPVIGSRPGAPLGTNRPVAPPTDATGLRPAARTVPPVIGARPGTAGAPMANPQGVRKVGDAAGATGRTAPAPGASRPAASQAPRAAFPTAARPGGGIAANPYAYSTTGQRLDAEAPQAKPAAKPKPKAKPKRPAGLRGKPVIRRPASAAIERAIRRGASPAADRGPGQDVFAKFDKRKADESARQHAKVTHRDSDDPWFVDRNAISPVIGRRPEGSYLWV